MRTFCGRAARVLFSLSVLRPTLSRRSIMFRKPWENNALRRLFEPTNVRHSLAEPRPSEQPVEHFERVGGQNTVLGLLVGKRPKRMQCAHYLQCHVDILRTLCGQHTRNVSAFCPLFVRIECGRNADNFRAPRQVGSHLDPGHFLPFL
jgi:hypothetical protein